MRGTVFPASVLLVCGLSPATAQRASNEPRTVRATYPPYAGDPSGTPRHVTIRVTGAAPGLRRFELTTDVIQMPHTRVVNGTHPMRESTRAYMHLAPGTYPIELSNFVNMSELESDARYSGPGGKAGAVNEVRVTAIRIDAR